MPAPEPAPDFGAPIPPSPIAPTPIVTPPTPAPELPTKPKRKLPMGKILWVVAALAALGLVGGGVYYWQNTKISNLNQQTQSDEAVLKSQINALNDQLAAKKPATTATAPASTSDTDDIKLSVKSDCDSDVSTKSVAVGSVKIKGSFATASDDCPLKTAKHNVYTATLKKVDGLWNVIYVGHNQPPASVKAQYGIPATLYK